MTRERMAGLFGLVVLIAASEVRAAPAPPPATAPAREAPGAWNMRLVGHHDLFGRPAYMPHVQKQGDRWILYVAHHTPSSPTRGPQDNGTTILDVTNPARPSSLWHIASAAPPNNETRSVRSCTLKDGRTYLLRSVGQIYFDVWDTTDLSKQPERVATIAADLGLDYTHKINWECETGIAYLPLGNPSGKDPDGVARWRPGTRRLTVWDLGNPREPKYLRSFGLAGMLAGQTGPAPTGIHHAIVDRERKRLHIGYGCCGDGIYQIVDRAKLLASSKDDVTSASLGVFPQPTYWGVHTAYPLNQFAIPDLQADKSGVPGKVRDLALVVGEAGGNMCDRPRQSARMFDVTEPAHATAVAGWWLPAASGDFCSRKGRFGPHSTNESYTEPFYGKMVAIAYFNAGVRMVDIRDPFNMKEVAYFVPPPNANTYYCEGGCFEGAIQTNNAEVDSRGLVYIVDRAGTGVHILELTGDARKILE